METIILSIILVGACMWVFHYFRNIVKQSKKNKLQSQPSCETCFSNGGCNTSVSGNGGGCNPIPSPKKKMD